MRRVLRRGLYGLNGGFEGCLIGDLIYLEYGATRVSEGLVGV